VRPPADAHGVLETTGCDFGMAGRAALGNPWIFRELAGGDAPPPQERCEGVLAHFRAHVEFVGDVLGAVRSFRRHMAWYAHGLHGAAAFRAEVNALDTPEAVEAAVRRFFVSASVDVSGPAEEQDVDYRAALG
jgi:tRNA-dihydrouridine synthase